MNAPLAIDRPWVRMALAPGCRVLSWALNRPGFTTAPAISWREVRNADLTPDLDVKAWLIAALAARGTPDDICFLTSRDVRRIHERRATEGAATVRAVATVGLSNAEAVGTRLDRSGKNWDAPGLGTINVAVETDAGLSEAAMIEALSVATQARTAAVMEAGHRLPTGTATGTGTDCIAIAAPPGKTLYAGLHTDLGLAIGRAVKAAVSAGAAEWAATYGAGR
ncbi:MAG: adenosylcobinamide amidohydrolase [Pseudomonadota bacterium]